MLSFCKNKKKEGFTLIELLVVVAIIGILASVVLASLNTARTKGRIAAIKSNVLEFRTIMELEYNDNFSYANLNKGWAGTTTTCESRGYAGNYASKATDICNQIRSQITNQSGNDFYTGVNTGGGFSNSNDFSIIARLPSGLFFCVGSSGRNSELGTSVDGWMAPGCYGNP